MIEVLQAILPYITGLWTLPWILIGFVITILLSKIFGETRVNTGMKKIGLLLLFIFVPSLLFRIFLNVDFGDQELSFAGICILVFVLMYALAYGYAKRQLGHLHLSKKAKNNYLKTVLTNQGRSSAFVGGAMLAIAAWQIPAAIYMSVGAIFLFAIIPYFLSRSHQKEHQNTIHALPWYLRFFPWYLLTFAVVSVVLHAITGITTQSLGNGGLVFQFVTALTIPAALYYVGAGIHPHDLKLNQMKQLFTTKDAVEKINQWRWVRHIFFLTVVLTPVLTMVFFGVFFGLELIPSAWFSVIVINSILPITSTNMFLVPYGIDKKVTALSVTWTTLVCVPIVVVLISVFQIIL
jgi:hypothetical protein